MLRAASLSARYRVVVHPGLSPAKLAELYKQFTEALP